MFLHGLFAIQETQPSAAKGPGLLAYITDPT